MNIGHEMFNELTILTLKKEPGAPLVLDYLNVGPVTKDVDTFLNKKILRCATEILWSNRRPSAIIATFYEGAYHLVSATVQYFLFKEIAFIKVAAANLSILLERTELNESFVLANKFLKPLSVALKKSPVSFGQSSGLAPVMIVIEPCFPNVKGYHTEQLASSFQINSDSNLGPKGQAEAYALAQKNDVGFLADLPAKLNPKPFLAVNAYESAHLMTNMSQMLDLLADKHGLRRPERFGSLFCMI